MSTAQNQPGTVDYWKHHYEQAQAALAAVTLEREAWEKERAHFMTSFNAAMGEKRDVVVLSGLIDSLRAQLAACQSREAKALEELERTKYELNYLRNHRNERQAEAEADRDQLQAQVGALRGALTGTKAYLIGECILHESNQLFAHIDDALAQPAPAAPDTSREVMKQADKLEELIQLKLENPGMTREKALEWAMEMVRLYAPAAPDSAKDGARLIADERTRQISSDEWTPEHDDKHTDESMAFAAACFAAPRQIYTMHEAKRGIVMHDPFPWGHVVRNGRSADDSDGWHTYTTAEKKAGKDRTRQLVIAGALIAAEIDRLNRAAMAATPPKATP